jgi:hypothetical protein
VDYSLSDVAQLWVLEEATDDVWELLQPMERGQRLAFRSARLSIPVRPIGSRLMFFHTHSPGLSSGE